MGQAEIYRILKMANGEWFGIDDLVALTGLTETTVRSNCTKLRKDEDIDYEYYDKKVYFRVRREK